MHRLLHQFGGGMSCFRAASLALAGTLAMLATATVLAEAPNADLHAAKPVANGVEEVELFEAIQARQIAVKLIPKDSAQAQLLIANRTRRPLNVRLPRAFGGTPALAQIGSEQAVVRMGSDRIFRPLSVGASYENRIDLAGRSLRQIAVTPRRYPFKRDDESAN